MNQGKSFIHLKVKSHYSILKGSMKVSDIVSEAKKNKMPAVALTDNSNVFGAMEFTKACLEKGIQPIIGCNLYMELPKDIKADNLTRKNFNITLLVKNVTGWRNLSFLISGAYLNFKEKRSKSISAEELCKYNNGLICLFSDVYESDFNSKLNFKFYFVVYLQLD